MAEEDQDLLARRSLGRASPRGRASARNDDAGEVSTAQAQPCSGARHATLPSPIGPLRVVLTPDGAITRIAFTDGDDAAPGTAGPVEPAADDPAIHTLATQLAEYFAGQRRRFDLYLRPAGTPFQQRVWQALTTIPYGATLTYGELARRIGGGAHARPVGGANGRNPIPIIIPCHRVIGADGTLTGFGGGLERKRFLLALEGVTAPLASPRGRVVP